MVPTQSWPQPQGRPSADALTQVPWPLFTHPLPPKTYYAPAGPRDPGVSKRHRAPSSRGDGTAPGGQSCPIPRSQSGPTLHSRAWAWCWGGAPAPLRPCLQLTSPPAGAKVFLAGLPPAAPPCLPAPLPRGPQPGHGLTCLLTLQMPPTTGPKSAGLFCFVLFYLIALFFFNSSFRFTENRAKKRRVPISSPHPQTVSPVISILHRWIRLLQLMNQ